MNIEIKYMHTEYEAYTTCFWCKLKPSTISLLSALLIFFFNVYSAILVIIGSIQSTTTVQCLFVQKFSFIYSFI